MWASFVASINSVDKNLEQKASSPKLQVYNTALMSAQSGKSFKEAKEEAD